MDWNKLDSATSPEAKEKAEQAQANQRQAESDLAKAYARCFGTEDGKRVLADLFNKMVIGNTPDKNEPNINYMSAYKNGESGAVIYIQQQITRAEVI